MQSALNSLGILAFWPSFEFLLVFFANASPLLMGGCFPVLLSEELGEHLKARVLLLIQVCEDCPRGTML